MLQNDQPPMCHTPLSQIGMPCSMCPDFEQCNISPFNEESIEYKPKLINYLFFKVLSLVLPHQKMFYPAGLHSVDEDGPLIEGINPQQLQ